MQDFNALEGKSLAELREIGRALGVGNVMLKKKELLEQLRAVGLWDDVHGLVPNDGKQVLSAVGDRHDGAILHHGRGAFDGVHNTEDSIDILLREGVLFL